MARQAGPLFFTGTIGDVIFYKLGENYYARLKGSYNTKALQKPGARPLMQLRQKEFGRASQLASQVHRGLPPKERSKALYNALTKQARQLLRAGKDEEAIIELLKQSLKPAIPSKPEAVVQSPSKKKEPRKRVVSVLSNWQVSTKGKLHKRKVDNSTSTPLTSSVPILATSNNYCCPCVFSGPRFLLLPRGKPI